MNLRLRKVDSKREERECCSQDGLRGGADLGGVAGSFVGAAEAVQQVFVAGGPEFGDGEAEDAAYEAGDGEPDQAEIVHA